MRPIPNPSTPRTVLLIAALAMMFVVLAIIAAGCSGQGPATSPPETDGLAIDQQANDPPPPPPAPPAVNPPKKPETSPTEQPSHFSTEEFPLRFLEAMMQEAARRQQQQNNPRFQEFQRQMERLRQCARCGGAGSYRYVDQNGVLQWRQCPSCMGSGRAY